MYLENVIFGKYFNLGTKLHRRYKIETNTVRSTAISYTYLYRRNTTNKKICQTFRQKITLQSKIPVKQKDRGHNQRHV